MPRLQPTPPPLFFGGTGVLLGTVADARTGKPLSGITLFLKPAGKKSGNTGIGGFQNLRAVFQTEEDGTFRIEGLQEQRYQIDAGGDGYLRHLTVVSDAASQRTPVKDRWNSSDVDCIQDGRWNSDWERSHPSMDLFESALP